jgi:predicted Zn-dependent peptidase
LPESTLVIPSHTFTLHVPKMRSVCRWYSCPSSSVSVLPSGLRVVSLDENGPLTTLGLFINAGSRNEMCSALGVSQALSRLVSYSTFNRSSVRLIHDIENYHHFGVMRGREQTAIGLQSLRSEVPSAATLLLDMARPRCIEYEIRELAHALEDDTSNALACPFSYLEDEAHSTAFRAVGVGRSLYARRSSFSQEEIIRYLFSNWRAENSVVAAINVDHQQLVNALSSAPDAFQNAVDGFASPQTPKKCEYVGGESRRLTCDSLSFTVGFRGLSQSEGGNDLQRVIIHLLGNKLGQNWQSNAFTYSDTGLVTFSTKATSDESASSLVNHLITNFKGVKFTDADVKNAVEAVKANAFAMTDCPYTRLTCLLNECKPSEMSVECVNKTVASMLSSPVTLVSTGNSARLPSPSFIEAALK